eukprot:GHVN01044728.1.p2 GENE.GHVN01044728.1~~GHVN01044728.1.p2  ORF type:complete len:122 (+),score=57.48 GHVN01044728.1:37-366(+)
MDEVVEVTEGLSDLKVSEEDKMSEHGDALVDDWENEADEIPAVAKAPPLPHSPHSSRSSQPPSSPSNQPSQEPLSVKSDRCERGERGERSGEVARSQNRGIRSFSSRPI